MREVGDETVVRFTAITRSSVFDCTDAGTISNQTEGKASNLHLAL